jgi:TonB family protein
VQLGVSSDESRPVVKQLVEASAAAMERDCWRPARSTREVSAPPKAAVPVALTVKRSGKVDGARVSTNPAGYPGLGSCVVRKVRDWHFERLARDTNVEVTFHFSLPR